MLRQIGLVGGTQKYRLPQKVSTWRGFLVNIWSIFLPATFLAKYRVEISTSKFPLETTHIELGQDWGPRRLSARVPHCSKFFFLDFERRLKIS